MRVKLRSHTRLNDMFRIAAASILLTLVSILLGMFALPREGCIADYFEENSICKPCRDFVHPFCN
jgi:hypothetical protein